MKLKSKLWLAISVASTSAAAPAQTSNPIDPADLSRPVPAMEYQSVFSGYQRFQEQKGNVWITVNKEVGDNPGMGSMNSMKDMPAMKMNGADDKRPKNDMAGMAGHGQPTDSSAGKSKPAAQSAKQNAMESHAGMTMENPQLTTGAVKAQAPIGTVSGTGVVQQIDKANGKVKMTHDPIDALGWPRMTMLFRLKEGALADQVKEGERVSFILEKQSSGYVIAGFGKAAAAAGKPVAHDMSKGEKK
jgi:Cu/Ag efflux protein CusF